MDKLTVYAPIDGVVLKRIVEPGEVVQAGAAIIISSHLLSLFENLCTHIMVLSLGECRRFGTMSDVLSEVSQTDNNSALEEAYFTITQDKEKGKA